MILPKTMILLLALTGLASCVDPCAGWRKITISSQTVEHLNENDPKALEALIAHQEFGKAQGCWK